MAHKTSERKQVFFISLYVLASLIGSCKAEAQSAARRPSDTVVIATYNVENLFDARHDSAKSDEAFLPGGLYGWSQAKYEQKCVQLYRAISAIGTGSDHWDPPVLVGLCEVENAKALRQLVYGTPLRRMGYDFVHFESPDPRGIDVALLYQRERIQIIEAQAIPFVYEGERKARTRDLLLVEAVLDARDTFYVFQCHWPSKYGGAAATEPRRMQAALLLKDQVDRLLYENPRARILVMGDFNDEPRDPSLQKGLNLTEDPTNQKKYQLLNLDGPLIGRKGTHKFHGVWSLIDQILVSKACVDGLSGWQIVGQQAFVYESDFLLVPDDRYQGFRPFRTINGARYWGGYSDHLPLYIRVATKGR